MSDRDESAREGTPVSPLAQALPDASPCRDVFVSYASQDAVFANALVVALERDQITCWIAPRNVTPGMQYADGIVLAISGSQVFVS
jgi:hypothetical protein